jgi:hypothetical protein
MTFARSDERGIEKWLLKDVIFLDIGEFLTGSLHVINISIDILIEDKSIFPDSVALVSPKSNETHGVGLVSGRLSKHDVLNDS